MPSTLKTIALFILMSVTTISATWADKVYETKQLRIESLTAKSFVHVSFLESPTFGSVECNGLIFIDGNEAIVYDTPIDDRASLELIEWLKTEKGCTIKAVLATHFHADCVGGINAFHQNGITSYASLKTIKLARKNKAPLPQKSFKKDLILKIGNERTETRFYGAGHTHDNVVGYIPSEKILFGGCLIKTMNAGKGNLEDADTSAWPATVQRIKTELPDIKTVVPGHGPWGDRALLDYTVKLFSAE